MKPAHGFTALPLDEVYTLIEPGPVVLLATRGRAGDNVMAMSWHMMVEFTPPRIACVVSGGDFSFTALRANRACVIGIPPLAMAAQVVKIGNCSGRNVDKFATFDIPAYPAPQVKAPLIGGCFANLECRVIDTRLVNRFNLFVLEVVAAWQDPVITDRRTIHHKGYGHFAVDGTDITLPSRMP
ncbi:flavin reductase family protein [Aquabacter sp. L1I39]|uniref:flavin reductase family protein n=1 Tax=Aquabacter sp. L1I39 TaxID=2820278 RepID=UPI001ADCCF04|nr:flavin reductase family protein [Aquabacter sp. L1I39]QTL03119.1 flavin reductase family protein [Aquabacter sp. L1I39]